MLCIEREKGKARTSGMTLIEIVIVITIIGLFVGLAGPGLFRALTGARENKTKVRLSGLKSVITQYQTETGQYPSALIDLITRPADAKAASRWRGPYIDDPDKDLKDGWDQDIMYRKNPTGPGSAKRPFELYSWGPNGEASPEEEWINVWSI